MGLQRDKRPRLSLDWIGLDPPLYPMGNNKHLLISVVKIITERGLDGVEWATFMKTHSWNWMGSVPNYHVVLKALTFCCCQLPDPFFMLIISCFLQGCANGHLSLVFFLDCLLLERSHMFVFEPQVLPQCIFVKMSKT